MQDSSQVQHQQDANSKLQGNSGIIPGKVRDGSGSCPQGLSSSQNWEQDHRPECTDDSLNKAVSHCTHHEGEPVLGAWVWESQGSS